MNFSTLTGPPAPSAPGGPAGLAVSGYNEEQAERQENGTVEDLKLTWYDEEGPFKDMDVISRSVYDLPAPYNGVGSTTISVTISSDRRDEEKPDAALLVMVQYMGEGFYSLFTFSLRAERGHAT